MPIYSEDFIYIAPDQPQGILIILGGFIAFMGAAVYPATKFSHRK
jgi:hypothetical protein